MAASWGSPRAVLLTGFGWLIVSTLLGLAIFIGMVRGTPLPVFLRTIHVHGALVGGMLQILIGALLTRRGAPPATATRLRQTPFFFYNAFCLTLLVGFGLRNPPVVAWAGLGIAVTLSLLWRDIGSFLRSDHMDAVQQFYYGFTLSALIGGVAVGIGVSFQLLTRWPGHVRLLHIHLTVLAFLILILIGLIQRAIPEILGRPVRQRVADMAVLLLLPAGTAGLITGFWLSSLHVQLAAGSVIFTGLALHTFSQIRLWRGAGQPGNGAVDHLLTSNVLLWLATAMGGAVAVNSLWSPPLLPYGTLHLIAYTHVAFVGFLLQAAMGAVAALIPAWLAVQVTSQKKRAPYQATLAAIMDRWRAVQLFSLNGGTLSLCLVASLTWVMPMGSRVIHISAWIGVALLAGSLALFCARSLRR